MLCLPVVKLTLSLLAQVLPSKKVKAETLKSIGYSKSTAYEVIAAAENDGDIYDKRRHNGNVTKITGCALGDIVQQK